MHYVLQGVSFNNLLAFYLYYSTARSKVYTWSSFWFKELGTNCNIYINASFLQNEMWFSSSQSPTIYITTVIQLMFNWEFQSCNLYVAGSQSSCRCLLWRYKWNMFDMIRPTGRHYLYGSPWPCYCSAVLNFEFLFSMKNCDVSSKDLWHNQT
jgi:hypothetical protein